jgi:hypothetical protein
MIKLTLKQIHESTRAVNGFGPALESLAEQKPKTAKLAYRLSRIVEGIRSESERLSKTQATLLQEYGTLIDPETGQWAIATEKNEEFNEQWNGVLEQEVEVWGDPIKIDSLNDELTLTVNDYSRLGWLFTDSD